MNVITRNIPNSVTCLNLAAGCMAIILAFHGTETVWGLPGWQWASIFIGIAAVADFLDGFCARLLRAYSDLGKELDSLCDLVSFGVAPAMTVFNLLPAYEAPDWLKWLLLIIPIGAAIRLARFNIDKRQASCFIGLPVPANAIFWIGFCGMLAQGASFLILPAVFLPLVLFESWLMISPFHLFTLKFTNYGLKGNERRYVLILAAIISVVSMGVAGLMWLIVFYILFSIATGTKA